MSLESELKKLNANFDKLIGVMMGTVAAGLGTTQITNVKEELAKELPVQEAAPAQTAAVVDPNLTLDVMKQKLGAYSMANGADKVVEALQRLGVEKLSLLNPTNYPAILQALKIEV